VLDRLADEDHVYYHLIYDLGCEVVVAVYARNPWVAVFAGMETENSNLIAPNGVGMSKQVN
jgi:hypothetical protein